MSEFDLVNTWTRIGVVAVAATAITIGSVVTINESAQASQATSASATTLATTTTPTMHFPLRYKDTGPLVKLLQQRLQWVGYPTQKITGTFDSATLKNVKAFQAKWLQAQTGVVTVALWHRMVALTKSKGVLPAKCRTAASILCVDMNQKVLRWVVKGKVILTEDVRFGSKVNPTRLGTFHVYLKDRTHVSTIYHTSMPDAMFFSGGQAVHYSANFHAVGYKGASHGCVNERSKSDASYLFAHVKVGTKVYIYK